MTVHVYQCDGESKSVSIREKSLFSLYMYIERVSTDVHIHMDVCLLHYIPRQCMSTSVMGKVILERCPTGSKSRHIEPNTHPLMGHYLL